jgi:HEPN domain-containing protein
MAMVRLKEANVLLRLGLSDGAYYLAGYAVECALKACIAKGTRRYEFPDKGGLIRATRTISAI